MNITPTITTQKIKTMISDLENGDLFHLRDNRYTNPIFMMVSIHPTRSVIDIENNKVVSLQYNYISMRNSHSNEFMLFGTSNPYEPIDYIGKLNQI